MTRLLDIGVSGLTAHQRALATTGQNISNAGVEGYSRQEVVFETRGAQFAGDAFVGRGVDVGTIRRITDEYLVRQSFTDIARVGELSVFRDGIEQLDNLLSSEETGLSGSLDQLFASLQAASESPTSLPLRQQVLTNADNLISRYQGIAGQIDAIVDQSDDAMVALARQINSIADGLAQVNAEVQAAGGNLAKSNDLLDRRDQLLRDLSENIGFTTSTQDNGMINIFVGGGQALVQGSSANQLTTLKGTTENSGLELAIVSNGVPKVITERVVGGALGGILQFRSQGLGDAANQLGLVQTLASHNFNSLHSEGVDLNGLSGGDFFTSINDRDSQLFRAKSAIANKGSSVVSVSIDDPSVLVASDYALELSQAGNLLAFSITRQSDGAVINSGAIPNSFPQSLSVTDGFTVNLESGDFQAGDKFILSPARLSPSSVERLVADPASLALGLPVSTSEGVGNLGSGAISQVESLASGLNSLADKQLAQQKRSESPPLVVRFTSESTYDILDNSNPAQPAQLSPPLRGLSFLPGRNNPVLDFDLQSSMLTTSGAFAFTASAGLLGTTTNGNPGENIVLTQTDSTTGLSSSQSLVLLPGESASTAAARLSDVSGVNATANTQVQLQISDDALAPPMQVRLNGVDLTDAANGPVPNPINAKFLSIRINQLFAGSGISASANGASMSIRSVNGEDLTLENLGAGTDTITLTSINGVAASVTAGAGQELVVAGTVEVVLDKNLALSSSGGFLGASTASGLPAYLGYAATISGKPQVGDEFLINTGSTGKGDNRNALALAALQTADTGRGGSSINDVYAQLVGSVGNKASSARIDSEAAQSLLTQTSERLSSVSGVNLDEEAARLLEYEQAYNASAQVISIARSIFDSLLAAFR
jgi:flagellar hook-associated protein 1 FlgK